MKLLIRSLLMLSALALVLGSVAYLLLSSHALPVATELLAEQKVATQTRQLSSDIDQVDSNVPFDLSIVQGPVAGLTMEGEERLLSKVVLQQEGRVLRLMTSGMLVTMHQTLHLTLTLPRLSAINQSGSGDSSITGFNSAELTLNHGGSGDLHYAGMIHHLSLQASGSGNLDLTLGRADLAEIRSLGSGNLHLGGSARELKLISNGSGDVEAMDLQAEQAEVIARGSGNVEVYVTKVITVNANGSGDVEIYGHPIRKTISNRSSGEIILK